MTYNESFGASLKRERELRGITLQEIAEATRIRPQYLKAIESNHFEALPGFTFLKGYVRAYAQHVGLNPQEVLIRLDAFVAEGESEKKAPRASKRTLARLIAGLLLVALGALFYLKGCLS